MISPNGNLICDGCGARTGLDEHELEMLERATGYQIMHMKYSEFVGDDDPHFLKWKALRAKLKGLIK